MAKLDSLMLNIVDDDFVAEGAGKLVSYAVLLATLVSAGIVDGAALDKNMSRIADKQHGSTLTITKGDLGDIIEASKKKEASKKLGKWEQAKMQNVVARTLYMEARGEGKSGLDMVMTVIWNRTGGDVTKLADVCLAPSQFSCWNDISNKTPETYSIQFPKCVVNGKGGGDVQAWEYCQQLAKLAVEGKFVPVNPKWNSYYNPDKANPDWGSQMLGVKMVGRHKVGELKWITNKVAKQNRPKAQNVAKNTYTVKDGDTLWNIAGKNMAKVKQLKQLNGLKSDVIKPGQTLKLA